MSKCVVNFGGILMRQKWRRKGFASFIRERFTITTKKHIQMNSRVAFVDLKKSVHIYSRGGVLVNKNTKLSSHSL